MKQTQKIPESGMREKRIKRNAAGNEQLRRRHAERRRKRQRQIAAARSIFLFCVCAVLVFIILFMTPLFNIRKITVSGNKVITLEEINQFIGDFNGENLLKTSERDIKERLSGIAYIKDVSIDKSYFKTALNVNIVEREACGYLGLSGKYVLFDDECVILAETNEKPENIPLIIGVSDDTAALSMSEENIKIMIDMLKLMRELNLLEKTKTLDLSDSTQIKFNYDGRLDVACGSDVDLDRKLRLFEAMINNNNLAENAKGTVDLSITGNARYSP